MDNGFLSCICVWKGQHNYLGQKFNKTLGGNPTVFFPPSVTLKTVQSHFYCCSYIGGKKFEVTVEKLRTEFNVLVRKAMQLHPFSSLVQLAKNYVAILCNHMRHCKLGAFNIVVPLLKRRCFQPVIKN